MRRFLVTAPAWLVTGLNAVVCAAFLAVGYATGEHNTSWLGAFVWACITTALTVPFVWTRLRRQRREAESVTGPLIRAQQQDVHRAASTGVPPTDPALHPAALDLARYRLADAVRQRTGGLVTVSVAFAVAVLVAVTDRSMWFAVCAVLLGGLLVQTVVYPSRQRRRIARLEQATGTPARV